MSIDKRAPGVFRFRKMHKGKAYTDTFYGSEKEAKKAHEEFIYGVRRGDYDKPRDLTFQELTDIVWENHINKNLEPNTVITYRNCLDKLLPVFGKKEAIKIEPITIEKYLNKLSKTYEPDSIKLFLAVFMLIYNKGVLWRLIPNNPFSGTISKPKNNKMKRKNNMDEILSIEQISTLINAYKEKNVYQRAGIYLALGCGLRKSEIRGLKTTDIDFETNTIKIERQINSISKDNYKIEGEKVPKDDSYRTIIAPEFVIQPLREIIFARKIISKDGYIFFNPDTQRPVSKNFFNYTLKIVIEKNNLPNISFHDLRHLNASLLVNDGTDIHSVAKRLGHKSVSTTINTYLHGINEKDKNIADNFDKRFKEIEQKNIKSK